MSCFSLKIANILLVVVFLLFIGGCASLSDAQKGNSQYNSAKLVLQNGHSEAVDRVEYNEDGSILISYCSGTGIIKLWDTLRNRLIRDIRRNIKITAMDFIPVSDSLIIALGDRVETINIKNNSVETLFKVDFTIDYIENNPKIDQIVVVGKNKEYYPVVQVWNTKKKVVQWEHTGSEEYDSYVAIYAPDGLKLATASKKQQEIRIWDTQNGFLTGIFRGGPSTSLCFNPSSEILLSGDCNKTITVYNVETGKEVTKCEVPMDNAIHTECVSAIVFNSNGTRFVSVNAAMSWANQSLDHSFKVWDAQSYELLKDVTVPHYSMQAAVFHPVENDIIALGAGDSSLGVWNIETEQEIALYNPQNKFMTSVAYNENARKLISGSGKWEWYFPSVRKNKTAINIWDLDAGYLSESFGESRNYIFRIISQNTRPVFAAFYNYDLHIHNVKNGDLLENCSLDKYYNNSLGHSMPFDDIKHSTLSSDYSLFAYEVDKDIHIWDLDSRSLLTSFPIIDDKNEGFYPNELLFLRNQNFLLIADCDLIILKDISTGKTVYSIEQEDHCGSVIYSKTRDSLVVTGSEGVIVYNASTGEEISRSDTNLFKNATPFLVGFGEELLASVYSGEIYLYNFENLELVETIQAGERSLSGATFTSEDGTNLIFANTYEGYSIYNRENQHWISMVTSVNDQWIIFTDDGYFDSSLLGENLAGITIGNQVYSLGQFAVTKNRPDIILERLGSKNLERIKTFKFEYFKRLIKHNLIPVKIKNNDLDLGLIHQDFFRSCYVKEGRHFRLKEGLSFADKIGLLRNADFLAYTELQLENSYHTPEGTITKVTQKDKTAEIHMEFSENRYNLRYYNIFVNGVPVYPSLGKAISGKKVSIVDTIELGAGSNKIEAVCVNEKMVESFKIPHTVDYEKDVPGELYFVGFGVSDYRSNDIADLLYPEKDIEDMADLFSSMEKQYKDIHIKTFTGSMCNRNSINGVKELLRGSTVDDTVIVFISGHGVHDDVSIDPEQTYYFLSYETSLEKLRETAIPFYEIESLLENISARKKLLFMDTCESGEFTESAFSAVVSEIHNSSVHVRGLKVLGEDSKENNIINSGDRTFLLERDRFIFNDLTHRTGTIVFSSSRGNEFSFEPVVFTSSENGFFTKALLTAFQDRSADTDYDGYIDMAELQQFVSTVVSERASEANQIQTPVIDRDNLDVKTQIRWSIR